MKRLLTLLLVLFLPRLQAQDAITSKLAPPTSGPISLNLDIPSKPRSIEQSAIGPWGTIDYYQVQLFCPPDYVNNYEVPSAQTEWLFPNMGEEEFITTATNAGLTQREVRMILENSAVILDEELIRIYPKDETVRSLSPSSRAVLNRILSTNPDNRFQHRPFYFDSPNMSHTFQGTDLPRPMIQAIANLAYPTPSGRGYFLSSLPFLLQNTHNSKEEQLLLRALLRTPTLMLRLVINDESEIENLQNYWSAGFKNKDIMPLMESVLRTPDVERLDIAHLLPPTARRTLLSYPTLADGVDGRFPDWFWSCRNFFRFTPENVYADSPRRDYIIAEEFSPAMPPNQFGDLILLHSGSQVIHGCIHIAADIVYTKNSPDIFTPWVLMKLEDVIGYHDMKGDVTITTMRKKPPVR